MVMLLDVVILKLPQKCFLLSISGEKCEISEIVEIITFGTSMDRFVVITSNRYCLRISFLIGYQKKSMFVALLDKRII